MPILKHILAIVILIALHQSPFAWAEGEDTSPPSSPPQQNGVQPLREHPSEETTPYSPALLFEKILSSPTDTWSIPQEDGKELGLVDMLHHEISQRLLTTAVWLDSFFEDERVVKEDNHSYIRARYDVFQEERARATYRGPTFNIRLSLPQLEYKAHLVVSAESPEPATTTPAPAGTSSSNRISPTDERNVTTALNYILRATEEQSSIVRTGAQFSHGSPVLFIAPRYRHFIPLTTWDFRFTQEAVWKTDTKWQVDTLFDLERQLPHGFFSHERRRDLDRWHQWLFLQPQFLAAPDDRSKARSGLRVDQQLPNKTGLRTGGNPHQYPVPPEPLEGLVLLRGGPPVTVPAVRKLRRHSWDLVQI